MAVWKLWMQPFLLKMTLVTSCAIAALAIAADAAQTAFNTTVQGGDMGSARLVYGDRAAAGIRDALPAFADEKAYERYYDTDDDQNCDDACLHKVYDPLRAEGRIRLLTIGTRVTVLSWRADSQDPRYQVCRVRLRDDPGSSTWLLLCVGLKDQP